MHMKQLLTVVLLLLAARRRGAEAHGVVNTPPQRGLLSGEQKYARVVLDPGAPTDWKAHYPAGSKADDLGAGRLSQKREVEPEGWTPFRPMEPGFRWRSGVCGDLKGGVEAHRKGGEFEFSGTVAGTYTEGGVLNVGLTIVAHHNGFMDFHICNVDECEDGDISETCFRSGACQKLQRDDIPECNAESRWCGPIDRNHTQRWYLPCSRYPMDDKTAETFGPATIQYRLPPGLTCDHCVLHWYWATGNICNADGSLEYFSGPDRPVQWEESQCKGGAGAIGGINKERVRCGEKFPEEYLQCSDIRITPRGPANLPDGLTPPAVPPAPSAAGPLAEPRLPGGDDDVAVLPSPVASATPSSRPSSLPIPPTPSAADPPAQPRLPGGDYYVAVPPPTLPSATPRARPSSLPTTIAPPSLPTAGAPPSPATPEGARGPITAIMLVGDGLQIGALHDGQEVRVGAYDIVTVEAVTASHVASVRFFVDGWLEREAVRRPFLIGGKARGGLARDWQVAREARGRWVKIGVRARGGRRAVTVRFLD